MHRHWSARIAAALPHRGSGVRDGVGSLKAYF